MKLQQCYLCLSATGYRMVDEQTKLVTNEGISLNYLPTDNLAPQVDHDAIERGQTSLGIKPAKMALPVRLHKKLVHFPGIYNVTMSFSVVGQKQTVKPIDIDFVSTVILEAPDYDPTKFGQVAAPTSTPAKAGKQ